MIGFFVVGLYSVLFGGGGYMMAKENQNPDAFTTKRNMARHAVPKDFVVKPRVRIVDGERIAYDEL